MAPLFFIWSIQSVFPLNKLYEAYGGWPSLTKRSSSNVLNKLASAKSGLPVIYFTPVELENVTFNLPSFAFLVVTSITPLAPLTPNMAREDGSFNSSMDSMSFALI